MTKKNNQKPTAASTDQAMSWSQYWSWFTSNVISDEERKATFLYFLKANVFEGMPEAAKVEVLEFAPDYVLFYLVKIKQISQELVNNLKSSNGRDATNVSSEIHPMTYKELLTAYKR